MIGCQVITLDQGEIVGTVKDFLVDRETWQLSALILNKKLFSKEPNLILRNMIQLIGTHVVLIQSKQLSQQKDMRTGLESYNKKLRSDLSELKAITNKGAHIATLNGSIFFDEKGKVNRFGLSKVIVKHPMLENKCIPLEIVHSLGPDVLIIESDMLQSNES